MDSVSWLLFLVLTFPVSFWSSALMCHVFMHFVSSLCLCYPPLWFCALPRCVSPSCIVCSLCQLVCFPEPVPVLPCPITPQCVPGFWFLLLFLVCTCAFDLYFIFGLYFLLLLFPGFLWFRFLPFPALCCCLFSFFHFMDFGFQLCLTGLAFWL